MTGSQDEVQLTNDDLLEGLRVGQKYVDDLDKLERDMVKILKCNHTNIDFNIVFIAVGEQQSHRRERRSGLQPQIRPIYAPLAGSSGPVKKGRRSTGRPSTFE